MPQMSLSTIMTYNEFLSVTNPIECDYLITSNLAGIKLVYNSIWFIILNKYVYNLHTPNNGLNFSGKILYFINGCEVSNIERLKYVQLQNINNVLS